MLIAAVTSGRSSVSEDKKTVTIKMTGTTNLTLLGKNGQSVIVAKMTTMEKVHL